MTGSSVSTAISTAYRDHTGNERDALAVHVFALDAPLTPGKTVSSITLPNATGGDMHLFSIAFG